MLTYSWLIAWRFEPEWWRFSASNELCAGRTDGQTHRVTSWAPVGAKNWFQVFHKDLMNIKRGEEAVGSDISYKWCEVITFYHQKRWQISQLSLLILEFQFHDSPPIVFAQGFKVSSCNLQAVNWLLSSTGSNQYQIFLKWKQALLHWAPYRAKKIVRLPCSFWCSYETISTIWCVVWNTCVWAIDALVTDILVFGTCFFWRPNNT